MNANEGPAPGGVVIRHSALQDDSEGVDLRRLLPAWIISGVIHVALLSFLLLVTVTSGTAIGGSETAVLTSEVDSGDSAKDKNLEVDELGENPDLPTCYNLTRIEDYSTPAPVNPNELPGLQDANESVGASAPPPPGYGRGESSGIDSPTPGKAPMEKRTPGGWGGAGKYQPLGLAGRSGATKENRIEEGGGNTESEAAVAAGLKWIVRHQALDGHWSLHEFHAHGKCNCSGSGIVNDMSGTGLGLLPLLGAGETHKGTGKNHMYAKNVERALKWLITKQAADGQLGDGYAHAICTICLCEAFGMTADPFLKGPAQRALNCCVAWQHTGGGFRYKPRDPGDLSITGWFVQALKSGQMAGLNVPNATWNGINNYLDSLASNDGAGYWYGQNENRGPAPAVTAVGLLNREYLGWGPRSVGLQKGVEYLRKLPPSPNFKNMYYYYYATQVMHHMAPFNPEAWAQWNPQMRGMLINSQDKGKNPDRPDQKGSWSNEGDAWGGQLGRLGYTSLALLTLEVYYRHLPLYSRELAAMKDEAIKDGVK